MASYPLDGTITHGTEQMTTAAMWFLEYISINFRPASIRKFGRWFL